MTENDKEAPPTRKIVVRQHSPIIFWWPVWLVGFLFAALSFLSGEQVDLGGQTMWFYPSRNLGVIFVAVFGVVFFRTNVTLRGTISFLIALLLAAAVVIVGLLGWWDTLFSLEQHLSVHMDAGFYLVFSLLLFGLWAGSIFVVDRFRYCEFRPGQLIVHNLLTDGARTFDTHGMSVYKVQDDRLRHWLLGMGTGDMHIATSGAEAIKIDVRNVTFIDRKLAEIERFVAVSPDKLTDSGGQL
jgi:hypothetical protein